VATNRKEVTIMYSSYYDYKRGQEISMRDEPFYALIQAAMRKADDINLEMLRGCWPEVWKDLERRYRAPGGILDAER
jgi:hypothetical protein